jgi:hypothetical protein
MTKIEFMKMGESIGRLGYYRDLGLRIFVHILDAQIKCGELFVLVEPVQGSGKRWVCSKEVDLETKISRHNKA